MIDELAWYLQEGRAPTEIAARLAAQSGVEFCFDGAAPAFFRIETNALREHWPAAMQIIGGFKELGSVVLRDFAWQLFQADAASRRGLIQALRH